MSDLARFEQVLVTGGNGYIGSALVKGLKDSGYQVVSAARNCETDDDHVRSPDLSAVSDWSDILSGYDVLIHTAGRAHVIRETADDPLSIFRSVNVAGTLNLANQAIDAGIKRFVFLSSIGVNEGGAPDAPRNELMPPNPKADYAISKYEAEKALVELFSCCDSELVIVRPALVYSAGAPGNFKRLCNLAYKNIPLPIKKIKNHRSLLSLDGLVDFLILCVSKQEAADEVFLLADDQAISTYEIIESLGIGMGKKTWNFSFPPLLIEFFCKLIGISSTYDKVFGDLVVDSSKAREVLGWTQEASTKDKLKIAGEEFVKLQESNRIS